MRDREREDRGGSECKDRPESRKREKEKSQKHRLYGWTFDQNLIRINSAVLWIVFFAPYIAIKLLNTKKRSFARPNTVKSKFQL